MNNYLLGVRVWIWPVMALMLVGEAYVVRGLLLHWR